MRRVRSSAGPDPAVAADENGLGGGGPHEGLGLFVVDVEELFDLAGATFVDPGVGELLHAATIAVVGEVSLDRLWHAVPSFPTISEVWLRLLEAYGL